VFPQLKAEPLWNPSNFGDLRPQLIKAIPLVQLTRQVFVDIMKYYGLNSEARSHTNAICEAILKLPDVLSHSVSNTHSVFYHSGKITILHKNTQTVI